MLPLDDPAARLQVVVNDEGQHALWPVRTPLPAGWRAVWSGPGRDAVGQVERRWRDERPRSLRAVPFPADGDPTVPADLLGAQAAASPDALAVLYTGEPGEALSYGELDARANRLAHGLLARGAGPESVVALLLPRCADLVVAMVAVLKAGAAYLPLDTGHPAARNAALRLGAGADLVLTTTAGLGRVPGPGEEIAVDGPELRADLAARPDRAPTDADRPLPLHAGHPAYVIGTSGSTGAPKAISMPGRGLVNLLRWHAGAFPAGPRVRTAQLTAIGFDFSVQEVLAALTTGRTLVVPPDELRTDPDALVGWIDAHRITELFAPTAVIDAVLAAAQEAGSRLPSLTDVLQGGEALTIDGRIREFCRGTGIRLANVYGPAETHAAVTAVLEGDPDCWPAAPPVGPPLTGMRVHVLDDALDPVPDGASGEVWVAGVQVSRGYRGRPGLTAQRFVPDRWGPPGSRMYRTGDLGRMLPDGQLELHGRVDDQVKIRGNRVEPGEVEAVLLALPGVTGAAVVADRGPGGVRLVAFVVLAGRAEPAAVRRAAAALLPDHMVPSVVEALAVFPLSANGKIDRRALSELSRTCGRASPPARPAAAGPEQVLCALWAEVLDLPAVGPDDDFFDLGGHSLLAGRLAGRIRAHLRVPASARLVYSHPTPATLAADLASRLH
jgi:amino acid adenylation domain-containing protein